MMDDFVITLRELQATGFCTTGVKPWFNAHGLDFKDCARNGVKASVLIATGDAMGQTAVDRVRAYKGL